MTKMDHLSRMQLRWSVTVLGWELRSGRLAQSWVGGGGAEGENGGFAGGTDILT